MPRTLTAAAGLLLAAALARAPLYAQAHNYGLLDPPVSPAAPRADLPVAARLELVGCSYEPIVAVRRGDVIDLRYQGHNCPMLPPHFETTVDLGTLPAGTYTLRVVEVSDAQNPSVDQQTTFTVEPSSCNPVLGAPPELPELCLQHDRFRVTARWTDYQGHTGAAIPTPISDETGGFWFFSPGNRELMVKVLDGCSVDNSFWVYAAGLTDVAVVLTVTDTTFNLTRTYTRPAGSPFATVTDTAHFPCQVSSRRGTP